MEQRDLRSTERTETKKSPVFTIYTSPPGEWEDVAHRCMGKLYGEGVDILKSPDCTEAEVDALKAIYESEWQSWGDAK